LQEKYNIYTNLNDINSKNLVEVGFFVHHLVRHETAECKRWLFEELPEDTSPFQQEIVTVLVGPNNQRSGTGVLKIFADESNLQTLSDLLRPSFIDPNKSHFLSKEYFNTLNPQEEYKYILSKSEYQKKYRTILVSGIRSISIPSTVTDNKEKLSVHEWLLTIPDYQQRSLFTHVHSVNQYDIEPQSLETNKAIAKKWARNAKTHIS
jgi:hypothetical protein